MSSGNNYNLFKNLILFTFVILLGLFIFNIQFIVILFFSAFITASAIEPLVKLLSKKMPRKAAVITITILGLIIISLFLIPFINALIAQAILFIKQSPVYWEKLTVLVSQLKGKSLSRILNSFGLTKWINYARHLGILPETQQIIDFASKQGQNILSGSINFTRSFFSSIMFIFTLAMLTLFMLIDKDYLKNKILSFFPEAKRNRTVEIFKLISQKAGGYVISQLVIIFAVFLLVSTSMFILGVQFALILGVGAAFLELIPVIGPILTAIIIVLVALVQKPVIAVIALVLYIIIQWVVDNVIRPVVVSRFLAMHPLTFIFSLFVGATFLGIPGLILAPAFVAVVCVLIDELYLNKINT